VKTGQTYRSIVEQTVSPARSPSELAAVHKVQLEQLGPRSVPKVLILGGTSEAYELATFLTTRSELITISSLAGEVTHPRLPPGTVRVGGFGGVDGLMSYLAQQDIAAVIDATHPFAVQISSNAEAACRRLAVPLMALDRKPWVRTEGDLWHEVADFDSAADLVDRPGALVFLSIGRRELPAFANCRKATFLIRSIEAPVPPLPPHHRLILSRGPFEVEEELRVLKDNAINFLVTKNSGGHATYAKIEAARALRIPVLMIARPRKTAVPIIDSVDKVWTELKTLLRTCSGTPAQGGTAL